jgi:regulator of sigma D
MHFKTERQKSWTATDTIIDNWLQERQALLVLFTQLCQSKSFLYNAHLQTKLDQFCQLLVDYVSAGQFEVFEKIFEASELDRSQSFDKQVFVGILRSTLFALDFNDKYTNATRYDSLEQDLSKLGEHFARRLELEDYIIDLYVEALRQLNPS